MKGSEKVKLAIACLALAILACQSLTGGGNQTTEPNATSASANPGGDVVFTDDFSSSNSTWGIGTDADSSVEYDNETLRMKVFTKNISIWSTPNKNNYENVHIEITVNINGSDSTTAFGVLCDQQVTNGAYYYFVITPDGDYAIAKASLAQADVFLTNADQWASSSLITKNAPSYRIGADCGKGNLILYVDGKEIASANDPTYTSGTVGLITWTGENLVLADITFDDFVVTSLP